MKGITNAGQWTSSGGQYYANVELYYSGSQDLDNDLLANEVYVALYFDGKFYEQKRMTSREIAFYFDYTFDEYPVIATLRLLGLNGYSWESVNLYMSDKYNISHCIYIYDFNKIRLNMNLTDPTSIVSGDINGDTIQWIRSNSHRYLGKYTGEGEMTICKLDDSDSTKYWSGTPATLTGEEGDVFMKLPKFYYKAEEASENIWDISFAYGNEAPDTTWKTWDGNDLIGVYESYVSDSKVYSWSGLDSTGDVSQGDFKTYARNRGTGYSLVKWKHHSIMCFLFYALYGNTNCQDICGYGTDDTKLTGATNSLGMEDTTSSNGNSMSINFWGLENWWGNKYEWVDNVLLDSRTSWIITEDDGSTRSVITSGSDGYISVLGVGEWLDAIPLSSSGSGTTGLCDTYYAGSSGCIVARSNTSGHFDSGVACVDTCSDSSVTFSGSGSRLAFRGTLVEVENIGEFKNIAITN